MNADDSCIICAKLRFTHEAATFKYFSVSGQRDIAGFARDAASLSVLEGDVTSAKQTKDDSLATFRKHQLAAHGIARTIERV
jgi:hypothetical protein